MFSSRPSLKSLKRQAYELYGVSSTRELKAQVGNFDFRRRESWLEVLGLSIPKDPVLALRYCEAKGANNIYPFTCPLDVLFERIYRTIDEIIKDD